MRKKSKTNAIIIEQDWDNPKSNINIETDVSGKMKVNGCFFHNSIMELSIFLQCLNPQNYAASANGCPRCLL